MAIFLFFTFVGLAVSIVFAVLMNRLRRRKATYQLYEVRDNFILLTAKNILSEDSIVFKYYYKRINMLLQFAPNIGIDDALKAFILQKTKTPKDLVNTMERAKQEAEKVLQSKDLEDEQIALAVQMYYSTNKEMILAHSSVTRILYYAFSHGLVTEWIISKVPLKIQKALAVIKFSGDEYNSLNRTHCTH